jgi:signal transduction histidine kinase
MTKDISSVSDAHSATAWKYFLSYKAQRSHSLMAWCGVFIFPAFTLLDYLLINDWELFFIVRLCGALAIFCMLALNGRYNFRAEFIGHFSCNVVFIALMWMLSWIETPTDFFIYSLNASTAYIASAIFLLWKPRHSIIMFFTSLVSFIGFWWMFSSLSATDVISHGLLVLLTIILMTQLYSRYRYDITRRDFTRQLELNQAYEELKVKNFEINQRNFEILQQKEKLEELNALKDRLFMIISHDFRSPLHSLKGLIVLLNDSEFISPDEFRVLLKGLKYNVDQTYDLLENLLFWSKSQMKGFSVNKVKVNVYDLVFENNSLLRSFADKKDISIVNLVDPAVHVKADEDMTRLILRNLISNAIKFTDSGGIVTVHTENTGDSINISVADTGIGVGPSEKFDLFAQSLSKSGTQNEKGTGLGLMICKEFVEKNNGKIWVESEPRKGSRFTFSLPAFEVENSANASRLSFQ